MIIICGPCVIENLDALQKDAELIFEEVNKYHIIDFYFKASCLKENRTRINNYRGLGFEVGIEQLLRIKAKYGVQITTDFHTPQQITEYGSYVDLIQIPAFLAMQTSLIEEAVKTRKTIHIKKPQWLPPHNSFKPVTKAKELRYGTEVFITDRGTSFGYGNVIFDPRHIKSMKLSSNADKILVDITHLQNHSKIYDREYSEVVGLAAIAAGADGLFMESTFNPLEASCDSDSMINIDLLSSYLKKFVKLYEFINA